VKTDMTDYEAFLAEYGLTDADISALADFGYVHSDDPVFVSDSSVHGQGLFAGQRFQPKQIVCLAQVNGQRTHGGRFANHSNDPNVLMVRVPDELVFMALRNIEYGDEILLDYRQAMQESDFGELRRKVLQAEELLNELPQVDCPVTHHFAPNVYVREMFIPANVLLTGAVHKTCHLSMLSKGKVRVITDTGAVELTAPATVLSQTGAKRAIYAIEDAVWSTIHATNETDVDRLVEELTESTADELLGGAANRQIAAQQYQQLRG